MLRSKDVQLRWWNITMTMADTVAQSYFSKSRPFQDPKNVHKLPSQQWFRVIHEDHSCTTVHFNHWPPVHVPPWEIPAHYRKEVEDDLYKEENHWGEQQSLDGISIGGAEEIRRNHAMCQVLWAKQWTVKDSCSCSTTGGCGARSAHWFSHIFPIGCPEWVLATARKPTWYHEVCIQPWSGTGLFQINSYHLS